NPGALRRSGRRHHRLLAGCVGVGALIAALSLTGPPQSAAGRVAPSRARPGTAALLSGRVNPVEGPHVAARLPTTYDFPIGTMYVDCCPFDDHDKKPFPPGWSIATLIGAAGVVPELTKSVTIQRPAPFEPIGLSAADFDPKTPGGLDFPQSAC